MTTIEWQDLKISDADKKLVEDFIGAELPSNVTWNDIMPVVEKMRKVAFDLWDSEKVDERVWMKADIWGGEISFVDQQTGLYPICRPIINTDSPFINTMWQAVVQFILWYNSQTPKK